MKWAKNPISHCFCVVSFMGGAQGRNRTTDTVIFNHVLYQLSYLGPRIGAAWFRPGTAVYRAWGWACPDA